MIYTLIFSAWFKNKNYIRVEFQFKFNGPNLICSINLHILIYFQNNNRCNANLRTLTCTECILTFETYIQTSLHVGVNTADVNSLWTLVHQAWECLWCTHVWEYNSQPKVGHLYKSPQFCVFLPPLFPLCMYTHNIFSSMVVRAGRDFW